ncbi:phage lysis regulatory protein, LysB family [Buttiauxella agrestis]|uniref:Phage lysis regulatory protein, LysB family n=1 Tax=Buttiauxella agrestis TaxID=82977 RepID=A0A381CC51_9ENTR|nr:Rz-like lysis system protein LysB [Buttiauxella agrestis]SUW65430.1 phage lysis regulatory protein, LysB family [Buttiauxella agrestis]
MKTLMILLLLAVAGLMWMKRENNTLTCSFEKANRVAGEQKTQITMLRNQLDVAAKLRQRNEQAQVDLRNQLATANRLAANRGNTVTRLLNENKALRDWYESDLPDDIIRLHTRPAFTTTADYLQWLSESGAVSDTGKQPAH